MPSLYVFGIPDPVIGSQSINVLEALPRFGHHRRINKVSMQRQVAFIVVRHDPRPRSGKNGLEFENLKVTIFSLLERTVQVTFFMQ